MFGSCILYQIVITSLFKYIWSSVKNEPVDDSMLFSSYIAVPSAVIVLLPLSLKRDMSAFRYVSLASIGALFYTGIVLIAELPAYYKEFKTKPGTEVVAAYWDLNIFTGASMTFFAYTCQVQMLPIYSELVNPSYSRMKKVI